MMRWPHSTHFRACQQEDEEDPEVWIPAVLDISLIYAYHMNATGTGTSIFMTTGQSFVIREQFDKFRKLMTALECRSRQG